MELPKRKPTRLKDYDYSKAGAYFITICTKGRAQVLSEIVGDDVHIVPQNKLTEIGLICDKYINNINVKYENVKIDKYVIMPDHIHMLITLCVGNDDPAFRVGFTRRVESSFPTHGISQIVGVLKRLINKEVGENIFQTSFHDHIIRNEDDYKEKWQYIENNPLKWYNEKYFR